MHRTILVAMALLSGLLAQSSDPYTTELRSGIALDLDGKYSEAREHFHKAIDAAPPDAKARALRTMAISYVFEHNAAESSRYEQQAFDIQLAAHDFNAAAETADEAGRISLESGDREHALEWYRRGHETALKDPQLSDAARDLWEFRWESAQARIAAREGNTAEAQKHVAAAKAILDKGGNPNQARFYPYLTGYVAFCAGDYKTAIADLRQADQHDAFILSLLAQSYEKSGDSAEAIDRYRAILAINSHNPTNAFARPLAKEKTAGQ